MLPPPERLSIGILASRTDTKVQTIRYYESIGLLEPVPRTAGNQRSYPASALARLAFIRHARTLGFSIEDIRELIRLADDPERPCGHADAVAARHLTRVRARIASLKALETELEEMLRCAPGLVRDCRVIEVLSNHALCAADAHDGNAAMAHPPLPTLSS